MMPTSSAARPNSIRRQRSGTYRGNSASFLPTWIAERRSKASTRTTGITSSFPRDPSSSSWKRPRRKAGEWRCPRDSEVHRGGSQDRFPGCRDPARASPLGATPRRAHGARYAWCRGPRTERDEGGPSGGSNRSGARSRNGGRLNDGAVLVLVEDARERAQPRRPFSRDAHESMEPRIFHRNDGQPRPERLRGSGGQIQLRRAGQGGHTTHAMVGAQRLDVIGERYGR